MRLFLFYAFQRCPDGILLGGVALCCLAGDGLLLAGQALGALALLVRRRSAGFAEAFRLRRPDTPAISKLVSAVLVVLLLVALLIVLSGSAAAPFIYTLF